MNEDSLCVSALRALRYNLSPKFRVISIDYPKSDVLDMILVISKELTEDETQLAYNFCGEIKGDLVDLNYVNLQIIKYTGNIESAPKLKILLYALYK